MKILDLDFLPFLHINRYELTKLSIFGFDIYVLLLAKIDWSFIGNFTDSESIRTHFLHSIRVAKKQWRRILSFQKEGFMGDSSLRMVKLLHSLEFPQAFIEHLYAQRIHPNCRHFSFQKRQGDHFHRCI